MTLSLSPERMLEEIYAHSAAARLAASVPPAALLGSEQASMLRRLLNESLATVVASLSPRLWRSPLSSAPLSEMVELEVNAPLTADATTLRHLVESAVVAGVLEAAGIASGAAVRERALAAFRVATEVADMPGSITAAG